MLPLPQVIELNEMPPEFFGDASSFALPAGALVDVRTLQYLLRQLALELLDPGLHVRPRDGSTH